MLTVGSLFSGIGGLDLGLERAGMRVVWQCERDVYCRAVLRQHWPDVPCFEDVRTLTTAPSVDVIAGGFPCQPWSHAGARRGVTDARWLWPEMARVIRMVGPRYVVVENVPALLDGGIEYVLRDLAEIGFDAEWSVLSACALGAPHTRDRLFIVAYPNGGDGESRLGAELHREGALLSRDHRARAWSDSVTGALAPAATDPREAHELTRRLASAAGNAVVPPIAEWIGRRIAA